VFRGGETTAICIDALAAEGPLDKRELAVRMVRVKGLDESDKVLSATVALRIVQTLRMKAKRGKIDGTLQAENERNLTNKISRGGFTAAFIIQRLVAIGCREVRLDDA
jgi:hypothetical protein